MEIQMVLEAEPETEKPKRKSLRIQKLFYVPLIICLPQLILKPDNIWKNQNRHYFQLWKFKSYSNLVKLKKKIWDFKSSL